MLPLERTFNVSAPSRQNVFTTKRLPSKACRGRQSAKKFWQRRSYDNHLWGKVVPKRGLKKQTWKSFGLNCDSVLQPGGATSKEIELEIRPARQDDWWQVSEIHCRSFYPQVSCLMGVLLRFDRVESLKNGQSRGDLENFPGNFACFGAWLPGSSRACDLLSAEGIMRAQAYKRMPRFLQLFVQRPLRANFEKTPEDCGMIGSVIVDSLGEFVPQRRLKGFSPERQNIAYVSNLAVDQNFRRKGVGSRLLKHAVEVAQSWQCRSIILQCDPRNEGARQMYRDAGFRHVAYEPQYVQFLEGRVGVRLELMVKRL